MSKAEKERKKRWKEREEDKNVGLESYDSVAVDDLPKLE
jgi:hypothetical protein